MNRFAALSPDFEEEEKQRKQQEAQLKTKKEALAAKTEEKPRTYQEKKYEGQRGEERRPMERGRGRGTRPYRGRGAFRGGEHEGEYVQKERTGYKEGGDLHYTGDSSARHPFDRKSGTGRGTEVPKGGAGKGNWGNPTEDIKAAEKGVEGGVEEKHLPGETPKEGEAKKEEAPKVPEVPTYTYSEYQAMIAEKSIGLTTKKADLQVTKDPKAAGLVSYDKPQYSGLSGIVATKKKDVKKTKEVPAEEPTHVDVLGTVIADEPKHFRKFDRKEGEDVAAAGQEGERHSPAGRRGRGGYRGVPREEPKKAESAPFVLKTDEFPTF